MDDQPCIDGGLRELALFAGAGGGILGGQLLGWRIVCAVEVEPYAASVLLARQNDGLLPPFPVWDDVRTFDGRPWAGIVDVVSGGFPCQDISAAGKGAGLEGEQSGLWVEMARIIGEVRPRFAFVENSPMLTSRGLGRVLGDLATMGFDARWGVVAAADVGAPHLRKRIWIVANARSGRCRRPGEGQAQQQGGAEAECTSEAIMGNTMRDLCGSRGQGRPVDAGAREPKPKREIQDSALAHSRRQGRRQDAGGAHEDEVQHEGRPAIQGHELDGDGEGGGEGDVANPEGDTERTGLRQDEKIRERHGRSGNSGGQVADASRIQQGRQEQRPERERAGAGGESIDVPDTGVQGLSQFEQETLLGTGRREEGGAVAERDWWVTEPDVGGKTNGLATKLDNNRKK